MTLRDELKNIPEGERLDYVLSLLDPEMEELADLATVMGSIGPEAGRMFLRLWARRGQVISYDVLGANDRTMDQTRAIVHHLLRKIRRLKWPVKINAVYGIGYRMTVPDGWDWRNTGQ